MPQHYHGGTPPKPKPPKRPKPKRSKRKQRKRKHKGKSLLSEDGLKWKDLTPVQKKRIGGAYKDKKFNDLFLTTRAALVKATSKKTDESKSNVRAKSVLRKSVLSGTIIK